MVALMLLSINNGGHNDGTDNHNIGGDNCNNNNSAGDNLIDCADGDINVNK